jgi:hypothetical protein
MNNENLYSEVEFKAIINRILDDTASDLITFNYHSGWEKNFELICKYTSKWKDMGYLEIMEHEKNNKITIRMLSYIDRKSAIPGFLESSSIKPL